MSRNDGDYHDTVGIVAAVPLAMLAVNWGSAIALAGIQIDRTFWFITAASCVVTTLWLSPDLDLPRCKAWYRWGCLRWIWYPYAKMFSHRSPWSHGLLFGNLFRVLYLFPLWGWAIAHFDIPLSWAIAWLVGGEIANDVHATRDGWHTIYK